MKKYVNKLRRIVAAVLSVAMLIPMLTHAMPVYSIDAADATDMATNYGTEIGAVAEWDVASVFLASNPYESNSDVQNGVSISELPEKLMIVDYAYDDVNAQLWYKVDATPGYIWPEKYANYHWVYDYAVKIVFQNGMTGVFDAEGNIVTSLTMGAYDQPVLTAESSLQNDVVYQWQIEYETGKWVDIYGQDKAELTVTIGILASLLDENSTARLRCVSKSGLKSAASTEIKVTVDFSDLGEDSTTPTEPSLSIQMNDAPVTVITMKYGDFSYIAPLSAVVSDLSGDVSYTWKLIKMDGTEVLLAENADAEYTLDYQTINSNSQYYDSVMYKVTLSVTASNGADSITQTVEIQNLSNSVRSYFENENGENIDVYVAGNIPSDVTLDLTKTDSSVEFPSDSAITATLDITLRDSTGAEWQPAEGEKVKISVDAVSLGLNPGDFFTVYHMHEGKVQLFGPYLVDTNGYATFEVVGFSLFALSTSFEAVIGSTATFVDTTVVLNSTYDAFDGTTAYTSDLPAKVVVLAYAFDEVTCKTYVKIDAALGYTWPTAYAELHWVESTELATLSINGEAGIYDADNNPIAETTMGTYDEPIYTVSSTLQGEVTYQWQICYDTENDLWADIYGQTDASVKITVGMLASRLDANGKAYVRCVVSDSMRSAVSSKLAITVIFDSGGQGGEGEEDTYTADITIDDQILDSVEVYYGDYDFGAVLGATTNLTGNLTYSWDLYYEGVLAQKLSTESTLEIYYMLFNGNWEYVDDATRKATIVLTVSDGTNTCESTFVVYEITAAPVSIEVASYSLASATNIASDASVPAAEVTKHTVSITYKYENGEQAYEYYRAEFSEGVQLNNTVTFPIIQGYAPYLNGEQVNSLQLDINGNEVAEDVVYEVIYKPTLVNVTILIEHQNIYDDGYTQVDTKTIQRLTNSTIETITDFSYPGFYQLEHSKPQVAADGSTTITIRFNRLYFLMRFDLGDGGYGVQPVYARYGTEVEVPDPQRPGYIFLNWQSYDDTIVNSTDGTAKFTMPAYDCTVTALWEATDVNYTVVYWKENADPNADGTYGYSYWTSEVIPSRAGEYVSGSDSVANLVDDEQYFTYNDARTDKNVLVKGDSSTVVNVYYTRNSYTIYFYGVGECAIPEHTHGSGCNSYLICGKEVHTHTADCEKILTCGMEIHTAHTEACISCGIAEHTAHTNACLICGKTIHSHSSGCCTIITHSHSSECCTIEEHSHSISCLFGVICSKDEHTHGDGNCTCTTATHIHGDGNCTCLIEEHLEHTQDCYSDELHTHDETCYTSCTIHTEHTEVCYTYQCGNVGHTHNDACYSECTLIEHTHGNNCPTEDRYNETYYVIRVITAKYDADIYDEWPTADDFSGLAYWSGNNAASLQSSRVVTMNEDWCDTNDGLIEVTANYNTTKYQLNYWFEDFDQTSTATSSTRVYNSTYDKYYVLSKKYTQVAYYGSTSEWSHKQITGMTATTTGSAKRETIEGVYTFNLYYNRLRYTLNFHNIDDVIYTENNVMFEKPLSYYLDEDGNYVNFIIPEYPDSLEDGAYEFAGWYTTPECFEGTKFDFTTGKMPNGDLTLFAKWAPVKHNVAFYTSKDSATGELKDKIGDTYEVPHGTKINEQYIPEAPEDFDNGQYTFDGWFYMDNGVEKAFSFEDMTVTCDLNVYAKWISNKEIKYIFHFELEKGTKIADSVSGSGLAGETITVAAKGDTALYSGYQEGYFPNVKSHSIDLDIEDEDGLMEYTFVYTPVAAVPYSVYYVAETLKEGENPTEYSVIERDGKNYYIIADTKVYNQNRKAYVVEQFEPVSGYLPDAYQKSTAIVNGETNEIIFYYSVDNTHAYYKITHYTQNVDGTSWSEYRVIQNKGTIGDTISADYLDISGFTKDETVQDTLTSGKLTEDGLELKLYYVRNQYPYKVVYKVQESEEVLYDSSEDGLEMDYFEKIVSHTASGTYDIYDLVGGATQTLMIRVEADPSTPTLNVITFYYTERKVDLDYKIVGPDGTVYDTNQSWGELTSFGETIKISIGKASGSNATVSDSMYKFVGWYVKDQSGNYVAVTDADGALSDNKFTPTKEANDLWVDGTTYYAKFELNIADLIITKKVPAASYNEEDTFVFNVDFGNDGSKSDFTADMTVAISSSTMQKGSDGIYTASVVIKDINIGTYVTVKEDISWSWRYEVDDEIQTKEIAVSNNEVNFNNTLVKTQWLSSEAYAENSFSAYGTDNPTITTTYVPASAESN